MAKPRVFVTRPIAQEALDRLRQEMDLVVWPGEIPPSREVLKRELRTAQGVLCLLTDSLDREVLQAAPALRVISTMATGHDNVDVEEATRRGIAVGTTPGILAKTTADFAFALLLSAARRVLEGDHHVRQGGWQTWQPLGFLAPDVHQATLGIVGMGAIGLEVAKRALGFEMRVLYHSRSRQWREEEEYGIEYAALLPLLLRSSDFVSLHLPLTPETYHLIDGVALEMMKPSAILVNTARGAVVDTMALYEALRQGTIAGAALDVTDPEPLPPDHPLLTVGNVIVTPHIASASQETRRRMALMAAENLLAALRGAEMPHCVNPQVFQGRQ